MANKGPYVGKSYPNQSTLTQSAEVPLSPLQTAMLGVGSMCSAELCAMTLGTLRKNYSSQNRQSFLKPSSSILEACWAT